MPGIRFWGKTCPVALDTLLIFLSGRPNEGEPVRGKGAPSPLAVRPPPPANTFQMEQGAQTTAAFRSRPQKKGELNSDQNLEIREGIFLSSEAPKFPPRESCTDDVVQMKNLCMWGEKKSKIETQRGEKTRLKKNLFSKYREDLYP